MTDADLPERSYGPGTLVRHLFQSVVLMRRVVIEMKARGVDERWRFAGFAVTAAWFGVESVARDLYVPDAALNEWRLAYGDGVVLAGVFVAYGLGALALCYAIAAWTWVSFGALGERLAFRDIRTASVASGFPLAIASMLIVAAIVVSFALGGAPDPTVTGVIDGVDWAAMLLGIGYAVVAISAATGVGTLRILALQLISGLILILLVVAAAWLVGLVL